MPIQPHQSLSIRGTTLIEMLVATCLLGICMVTVATLLRQSSTAMTDNVYRQRATRLATDLAEVLRGVSGMTTLQNEIAAANDCSINVCDGSQFIRAQLNGWQHRAAKELPAGTAGYSVSRAEGNASAMITVRWRAAHGQQGQHILNIALAQ